MRAEWAKLGKRRRRLLLHTAILLALGIVFALITLPGPFASYQLTLSDQLFASQSASPNVVIAAIDDASLATAFEWVAEEEKWIVVEGEGEKWSEWPRSRHAQAIRNLANAQARVIGLDVIFAETSNEVRVNAAGEDILGDELLGQAMEEAGNVVQPILGIEPLASDGGEKVFEEILRPTTKLEQASLAIGHANVLPDSDEKVRRLPLVIRDAEEQRYPSLSLAMLHIFNPVQYPDDYTVKDGSLHMLERDIPVSGSTSMRIGYAGPPGTFTTIPYWKIIMNDFDPELVKHNIVLVGVTAKGLSDYWVTPTSGTKMWGVEVHANAIHTILTKDFLREVSDTSTFRTVLLLVIIAGLALPWLSLRWGGVLTFGLVAGYVAVAVYSFYGPGYIMNFIYPPIGVLVIYVGSIISRITAEQVDKREVKDLFGKYVSPEVAGEILRLSDTEDLRLGGEEREVTVLFTDIRGFTELSEQMPPDEIVDMLNKYFSVIIDRILANDGMINKFAGDNIMAVWNAPQSQPEHALLAVRAATESQQAINEMQQQNPDLPQVQFGFGINTGPAIAGNVGSAGRLEYTVIGDAVNLASRLCGAAPGGEVWISDQTYEQGKGKISAKALEPQYFKGKKEAVPVYQVEWRQVSPESGD